MTRAGLTQIAAASAAAATTATMSMPRRLAFCRHVPRVATAALPLSPATSAAQPSSQRPYRASAPASSFAYSTHCSSSASSRRPRTARGSCSRPSPIASSSQSQQQPWWALGGRGRRTIFIQTENTPNADAIKFLPNHQVLPAGIAAPFIEYLSPRATIAPPYPSPLAAQLMNVDGVTAVFYGSDFITVTKAADANWAHIRPEVFALITEAITSGQTIVRPSAVGAGAGVESNDAHGEGASAEAAVDEDTLQYNEDDSEVVGMIKELLETRIRPAIQEDGGDIEFRGFEDGEVLLKLRGACRTCDSSTVTLKNGIESMLMHYIEEVKAVRQVLDPEEEVSLSEFAKFEEKLRQQKGSVPPSTTGKGTLDTVP